MHGWAKFAVMQPMYNLTKRQAEVELLPLAQSEGLGVIPYSPLGGGLLTGKYGVGVRPESGRLVENAQYQKRYGDAMHWETADRFKAFAAAARLPAGRARRRLGDEPSGGDRAHHRRAQRRAA